MHNITIYHPDHTNFNMDFSKSSKKIILSEKFEDYYSGECPFCGSKIYKIKNSRIRNIQEIGGPHRKILVKLEVKTIICLNPECNMEFTPEHPLYPKNHPYSKDIIEQSLNYAHKFNMSAEKIAAGLVLNNSVDISPKTVQSWINNYSKDYFQAIFAENPEKSLNELKAITIDGTWFTTGKNVIGKKKNVQFSSVTKLADGTYLLTWWK